jgi:hypothetical protein
MNFKCNYITFQNGGTYYVLIEIYIRELNSKVNGNVDDIVYWEFDDFWVSGILWFKHGIEATWGLCIWFGLQISSSIIKGWMKHLMISAQTIGY